MDVRRSLEVLEALVGFDTTSRNSNLPLIEWVEAYLDRLKVPHERIPDAAGTKTNLWVTVGPKDVPGYILSGHTDVVPVDGQSWSGDPFRLTERNGRAYGRGATDMKGFDACCLAAIPAMQAAKLKRPIHLALSYDEEVGCFGARGIADYLRRQAVQPIGCFVGEPTNMKLVTAHKAKRSFTVTVTGRTCHSSLAPEGVNAVEYAARLVARVREMSDELARTGARDELYDVPFTTGHTGTLHGGTVLNIVPDRCVLEFEFRSIAADDPDALGDQVKAFARDVLEPEMKKVGPETGIAFAERSAIIGLETEPEAEISTLALALSGTNGFSKVAYGTEAGLFSGVGIPTVVIGPGSIDQAHKADEFIEIAELEKCNAFIARLIAHCAR